MQRAKKQPESGGKRYQRKRTDGIATAASIADIENEADRHRTRQLSNKPKSTRSSRGLGRVAGSFSCGPELANHSTAVICYVHFFATISAPYFLGLVGGLTKDYLAGILESSFKPRGRFLNGRFAEMMFIFYICLHSDKVQIDVEGHDY